MKVALSMWRFKIALQVWIYCILESFCELESNSIHISSWDSFSWPEFISFTKEKTVNLLLREEADIVAFMFILQLTENTAETGGVYKSVKVIRFIFSASAWFIYEPVAWAV